MNMSDLRKAIRNSAVDIIKAANTEAGNNVIANRAASPWTSKLPAISVRTYDETITGGSETPRELKRDLNLLVEICDKNTSEKLLSDNLDDIAEIIEGTFFANETLDDTIDTINLTSISIDIESDGEQFIGALKLTFLVTYYQYRPKDRTKQEVEDLETVHAEYELSDSEDVKKAEDTIDMT